jgi:hypothetical protein
VLLATLDERYADYAATVVSCKGFMIVIASYSRFGTIVSAKIHVDPVTKAVRSCFSPGLHRT